VMPAEAELKVVIELSSEASFTTESRAPGVAAH